MISPRRPSPRSRASKMFALSVVCLLAGTSAFAANGNWLGNGTDGLWTTSGNWNSIPGSTASIANTDTATFNLASTPQMTVSVDANRNLSSFNFTAAAGSYTIGGAGMNGGNALLLTNNGSITISAALTGTGITETFNAPLVLEPASSTTAGLYSFYNNAASTSDTLAFTGNISADTTSSTLTLNLRGTNTGNNIISGIIGNGNATGFMAVTKLDTGNWTLSGNNTYSGATTVTGAA